MLFRRHVLKNLRASGRIGQTIADTLDRFRHPGFSAHEKESLCADDSNTPGPASRRLLDGRLILPGVFVWWERGQKRFHCAARRVVASREVSGIRTERSSSIDG